MVSGLAGRGISKTQFPLWVSFPLFRLGMGEGDLQLDLDVKGGSETWGDTQQELGGGGPAADQVARLRKCFMMMGKLRFERQKLK